MFLTVVIPAFNEAERLPKTLEKVKDYLSSQDNEFTSVLDGWEILIVNDGSKDKTAEIVKKLLSYDVMKYKNFRLIDNQENKGKGAVVKQGMLEAKGDWRLFMDADGSTDISELPKLWKFANVDSKGEMRNEEKGKSPILHISSPIYDVIIGSRYLDKNSIKIKQPLMRRVVSRMGNILVRLMLGIKSVDTQCGFKLFSKEATEKIFPLQTINRWGFDIEILAIAIRKGYKIKEVEVDWYDAEGSQVKKSAALKTLKELWQIKWNTVRGTYK